MGYTENPLIIDKKYEGAMKEVDDALTHPKAKAAAQMHGSPLHKFLGMDGKQWANIGVGVAAGAATAFGGPLAGMAVQKVGSGLVDANTAAQAGDLFGAKALLVGRLVSLDVKQASIKPSRKKGWESYQQKQYNASTKEYDLVTKYKKVHYNEFFGTNSVSLTVEYKLISTETGEILKTNLISETLVDEVWYITYDANTKNLLSGSWSNKLINSDTDVINTSYQDRRQIQNLLKKMRI